MVIEFCEGDLVTSSLMRRPEEASHKTFYLAGYQPRKYGLADSIDNRKCAEVKQKMGALLPWRSWPFKSEVQKNP